MYHGIIAGEFLEEFTLTKISTFVNRRVLWISRLYINRLIYILVNILNEKGWKGINARVWASRVTEKYQSSSIDRPFTRQNVFAAILKISRLREMGSSWQPGEERAFPLVWSIYIDRRNEVRARGGTKAVRRTGLYSGGTPIPVGSETWIPLLPFPLLPSYATRRSRCSLVESIYVLCVVLLFTATTCPYNARLPLDLMRIPPTHSPAPLVVLMALSFPLLMSHLCG